MEVLVGKKYKKPLARRGVFERLSGVGDLSVSFPFQDDIDYSDGGRDRHPTLVDGRPS